MPEKLVMWDFDGTLALRTDGYWTGCALRVLDAHEPGHSVDFVDLRPLFRNGFPWHGHEIEHPELMDPAAWWAHMEELVAGVYSRLGFSDIRARELSQYIREDYLRPGSWRLYDDVRPALGLLREQGWRHAIVSNHVPELRQICDSLGLGRLVDEVITSAAHPWEKPHPGIYKHALERAGFPPKVWMVGDNPVADVMGAELVGIPAILVRPQEMTPEYVEKITYSWGGEGWHDWQRYVSRTAPDALAAAELIAVAHVPAPAGEA